MGTRSAHNSSPDALVTHRHHLHPRRVSLDNVHTDPIQNLDVTVEQPQSSGGEEGKVLAAEGTAVLVARMVRPLPLVTLHVMHGGGEAQRQLAGNPARGAAAVIEVQVGQDDVGNVLRGNAAISQLRAQAAA